MIKRVCIHARIPAGEFGGVEQVVLGLAGGFAGLDLRDFTITFLTSEDMAEQLVPLTRSNAKLFIKTAELPRTGKISSIVDRAFGSRFSDELKHFALEMLGNRIFRIPRQQDVLPEPFDLIHFPTQQAFWTDTKNIYHPHDLQHIHLPEYFSRFTYRSREYSYRAFCEQATAVSVTSTWIKNDLIENYGLLPDKIAVVPLAAPNQLYGEPCAEELERLRCELNLPNRFIFYPAQTWPHKNHLGLIRAAARISDQHGIVIPLVFSGRLTEFKRDIQSEIDHLGLGESVRFLGFVSPLELQGLYRLCTAVMIPSHYEAASFPLWEAYLMGAATACAATTSLPRQAQNASLLFDPNDVSLIATAMLRLWQDEELRQDLIIRGQSRVTQFSWEKTCSQFLALYRQILGLELTKSDRELLNCDPTL